MDRGSLRSLSLLLPSHSSLPSDGKSIGYRRKSSGNPGERVVATRKRRNEVLCRCSGSRPTLRFFVRAPRLACGNITYRACRAIYLSTRFFFSFSFFSPPPPPPRSVKLCVAIVAPSPNSFCSSGQIEISGHCSIVT